ncbi:unnamed protein product [Lactuca virosa]|uniref:Uncharacterized protein n=1 Tax=Lactuca virosa TaxID=75947 RepID=A0AAU9LYI9_9ASTR|nr:unnamed protein product [Lactuca virosa]
MAFVSSSILRLTLVNIKGLTQLHGEVLQHLGAVEYLSIKECDELRYLWESKLEACKSLVSLWDLKVDSYEKLVSEAEEEVNLGIGLKSIRDVVLYNCPRLDIYNCSNSIEKLLISNCHSVTSLTFPTVHNLPFTLKILDITSSGKLEMSWLLNNFLSSLESLSLDNIPNLMSFPEGCLVHLTRLTICGCDNIESIPDNGLGFLPHLCLTYIHIANCKNLKSFPHQHLQSLTYLEELWMSDCPSMDYSFPCGLWPSNLSTLVIGGLKKPMSEWGVQNFPTSLVKLWLGGKSSRLVSFAKAEEDVRSRSNRNTSFLLPSSLTFLQIRDFVELESLSEGLQHLTCLKELFYSVMHEALRSASDIASLSFTFGGEVLPEIGKKVSE